MHLVARGSRLAVACLLVLATAACETGPAADPGAAGPSASRSSAQPEPGGLSGSLLQFRRDVAGRRLQVRLTADTGGLVVEALELVVDGLPTAPADPRDAELRPGTPLDLPVVAGASDCAGAPSAPSARVRVRDGTGARREVTVPLDDGGLVRRLHASDCAEQELYRQVAIEVVGVRPAGPPAGPALDVDVRFRRVGGSEPVRVTGTAPNTIYSISAVGPLPTLDRQPTVDLALRMVPARCDPHALGESYTTGLIGLVLAVGEAAPRTVVLTPADDVRRQLETFAVDTCRAPTG
ncbi:hypothetical protein [Geodermatophilus sp. CPCC 206100]|uniref:hypothetical protein n=1 Tax=Geodermatophilus sp. CPCC 206100 TaxID=3020054 RepID=UPI003B007E83